MLLPLLMLLLKLTFFLEGGVQYGFGSPADLLIGAYGEPGSFARSFQLNPYSIAFTGNVTDGATAGPRPPSRSPVWSAWAGAAPPPPSPRSSRLPFWRSR